MQDEKDPQETTAGNGEGAPEAEEQAEAPEAAAEAEAPAEAPAEPATEADEPVEAEEPPAEDEQPAAEAEQPAAEAPAPEEEPLSPRERRKRARSRAAGPAKPTRSPVERAEERARARAAQAEQRRRWRRRARERDRRTQAEAPDRGAPTPPAEREGKRKVRQGVVVSSKPDKTITVRIDLVRSHQTYGKVLRESGTLHAHDERNQAGEGDVVRVMECRPLSRTKRWRLVEIVERAR
jgi:small subunit ribosomal protein S17